MKTVSGMSSQVKISSLDLCKLGASKGQIFKIKKWNSNIRRKIYVRIYIYMDKYLKCDKYFER